MLLEQPEEEIEDPKTFEENPMEFILKKYVSLDQVMTELMTKDYREYLDAVFIVSPKPTSFKIVLHNGQYFFLTYMGPAYEATVAGMNYYLSNIGEKERCMIAISKLLRGGNPLKTKGPEGAEKGAEAEGGEEGGESGLSVGAGAEEAGGEETPQLTESTKILSQILIEAINEEKKINLLDAIVSIVGGSKNSKKGLHARGNYGDEKEAKKTVSSAMRSLRIKDSDYDITTVYPGDFDNGARSSSFNTYKIRIKKQNPSFSKGEEAYLVSRETKTSSEGYRLKPQELEIPSDTSLDKESLIKSIKSGISKNNLLSDTQKKYLLQLAREKVSLSSSEKKEIAEDRNFINQVEKNFGELLGALHMLSRYPTYKVKFPATGNFPLVDFVLKSRNKTISLSSKSGSTIGNTVKVQYVLQNAKESGVKIGRTLKSILETIATSSVIEMPVKVADMLGTPEIKKLKNSYSKSKSGKDLLSLESAIIRYVNETYGEEIQRILSESLGSIVYVKTKIGSDLNPEYSVNKPKTLSYKLRSKNSQNRFSDRVGFDVK